MMNKLTRIIKERAWSLTFALSLGAVAFLRAEQILSEPRGGGTAAKALHYLCVSQFAVTLGDGLETHLDREIKIEWPSARVKKLCRPTDIPIIDGAEVLIAASAFGQTSGAILQKLTDDPKSAMDRARHALDPMGWSESGGSVLLTQRRPHTTMALHNREGARLFTVAVEAPDKKGSYLLMAKQIEPIP
jgi:hypothetical protein